jgi:endonuclease/exonuclease/phosphatase family metal-dependent hydrolase
VTPDRRTVVAGGLAALALPAAAARPERLRVMTFNVRVPVDREAERNWAARRPVATALIARAAPDLIGTQELRRGQAEDLVADLPVYSWFGRDRRGGHDDEHMGVFYRRQRLRLVEQGDFWLSDAPTVPGSRTWGHPYPRMVTWGVFETRGSRPQRFRALNTHFPYRAEDAAARMRCAEAILDHVASLPATEPLILTGDFNTDASDAVHAQLATTLTDARDAAVHVAGPAATFHGFGREDDGRRIDWIMTRGFRARSTATIDGRSGAVWASDHRAVVAELDWN